MDKIVVMVSSTVKDLEGERDAILSLYSNDSMFKIVGTEPYIDESNASSSMLKTIDLARNCDLFILVLGQKYGFELSDGRSATELEFDEAVYQDPTKVLVFLKKGATEAESKQKKFIKKVSDYYSGYWRTEFQFTHQLQELVSNSIISWLRNRAGLSKKVSYCEHFIREALQLKPTSETDVFYSVKEKYVELEYHAMQQSHTVQYDKKMIFSDFWGCLNKLKMDLDGWRKTWKR